MRNSFLVIIVFIFNFFTWLIASAFFVGIWDFLMSNPTNHYFFIYAFFHYLYLLAPLACVISIFSVYVFFMRHPIEKRRSFLFFLLVFLIVFTLVIPLLYSQAENIDSVYNAFNKLPMHDTYLVEFIESPFLIKEINSLAFSVINDIYIHYTKGYFHYLLFAGSWFLVILSFWGCIIFSEWKIINFSLLGILMVLMLYGYSFISLGVFRNTLQNILPLPEFLFIPFCLWIVSAFLLSYTAVLLRVKTPKKIKQKRHPKAHRVKTPRKRRTSRRTVKGNLYE